MTELIRNATHDEIFKCLCDDELQILIAGPRGVGKTALGFLAGAAMGKVVQKVQCHSELSPSEILGMWVPGEKQFLWEPGPIDICYSEGGLLIIDELPEASGPVKTFLYGATDRGPGGTISYVGRTFTQAAGYTAMATMNGWPDQGALPAPLLDRFDAAFILTTPCEGQYKLLEPDLRMVCREAYEKAADPMEGPEITFRMLMGLQKLRTILPLEQAVAGACHGNKELANSLLEVLTLIDPEDLEAE